MIKSKLKNLIGIKSKTALDDYELDLDNLLVENGRVPLTYWVVSPNFGDLLSPWLFSKLTGKEVELIKVGTGPNKDRIKKSTYISVGSVLSRAQNKSIVWGSGSFGTEQLNQISKMADYRAVRGPLTRCLVLNSGAKCPPVYGDPALLSPLVYNPDVPKTHEVGVVLRWSEDAWLKEKPGKGVKLIDLGTDDIEGVIREMKSCKRIITSSLHGLVIADSYGIPNAWLASQTPKGGEFKFFDYFLSVEKVRKAQKYNISKKGLSLEALLDGFDFDGRTIKFSPHRLLNACPFMKRKERS